MRTSKLIFTLTLFTFLFFLSPTNLLSKETNISILKKEKPFNFEELVKISKNRSYKYKNKSKRLLKASVTTLIAGPILIGAGFGLFLHDKAFAGHNSSTAQYSLMFSGFTLLGTGILLHGISDFYYNKHKSLLDLNSNNYRTSSDDFLLKKTVLSKKASVQNIKNHGNILIITSIPILALSIFSMYEAYNYVSSGKTISKQMDPVKGAFYYIFRGTAVTIGEILTLVPGVACLVGGIIMIAKANNWSKLKTGDTLFTLNNISPIINPITKTYGVSMGFSF